jgi:ABC-type multidrug transport system ATPase subunit
MSRTFWWAQPLGKLFLVASIGVELITDPSIILLDEPTSGLDSFKAHSVVKLLKRLARNEGKTIVSTIHSPSSQSFAEFDRLMFLQDGNVAFQGYVSECAGYFAKIGIPCPSTHNPADFYIAKLAVDYPKDAKEIKKIEFFTDSYIQNLKSITDEEEKAIKHP